METELALYTHLLTTQHRIGLILEMAADAEGLGRFSQAESLYNRALVLTTTAYDEMHPQAISILWDLARVCEKLNQPRAAEHYYNCIIEMDFAWKDKPRRAA